MSTDMTSIWLPGIVSVPQRPDKKINSAYEQENCIGFTDRRFRYCWDLGICFSPTAITGGNNKNKNRQFSGRARTAGVFSH